MAVSRYQRLLEQHRRSSIYLTPHDLLAAAVEYFEWCEDNPIQEEKVHVHNVDKTIEITRTDTNKVRAFTKTGLAQHIGWTVDRLNNLKNRKDEAWGEVLTIIEGVLYTQKFENAAAGLLNANIITRDLGLADKQSVEVEDTTPPPPEPEVPQEHVANHVHPDDPNPLNLPRPLYSQAQIDAGMPFVAPAHDSE